MPGGPAIFPLAALPPIPRAVAYALPTTHSVSLMQSVWDGSGWDLGSAAALVVIFAVCTAISTRVFRWE